MAVDRVGATVRPLSIPDRPSGQPGPAVRGPLDARDSNAPYPLAPIAPAAPGRGRRDRRERVGGVAVAGVERAAHGRPRLS